MPQNLNPTPSRLQQLLDLATTPLAGREFSMEEMYNNPETIMSPDRVLGMTTSPLDLLLTASGAGALSRFTRGAKASSIGRQISRAPQPPTSIGNALPTKPASIGNFPDIDPRVGGIYKNQPIPKPRPKGAADVDYEMIMRKIHGQQWQPRPGDVDIPQELLEKYKIAYPPAPRKK